MTKERIFDNNEVKVKDVIINNGELIRLVSLSNVVSVKDSMTGLWKTDSRITDPILSQVLDSRDTSNFIPTDDDVRKHLMGDIVTFYFRQKTEKIIGFDAIKFAPPSKELRPDQPFPEEMGVYLAGSYVAGEMQRTGLYTAATMERARRGIERGYEYVFTESQNPDIQDRVTRALERLKAFGEIKDFKMNERVMLKALYPGCMYKNIPTNPRVSFADLNYDAGDAYALIFHLELK